MQLKNLMENDVYFKVEGGGSAKRADPTRVR